MKLDRALENVAETYAESPLDFSSESDLQVRTAEASRDHLKNQNVLEFTFGHSFDIQVDGNLPQYASKYHTHLESSVQQRMPTRVKTELAIWHPLTSMMGDDERPLSEQTEILDLVVLREHVDRPIHLKNGRHRVEIEMVDTAVELKYPRYSTAIPSNTRGNIDHLSDSKLEETVDLERLGVQADLEELEALGQEYTIDPYFFICSQYDILRRDSTTNTRHQKLANAAVRKLKKLCDVTSVLYTYPGGWEWVTTSK